MPRRLGRAAKTIDLLSPAIVNTIFLASEKMSAMVFFYFLAEVKNGNQKLAHNLLAS
jgi:hypothetical protein